MFDCIFPKFCVGCGLEGSWLCSDCAREIIAVTSQVCPHCHKLSPSGKYCLKCAKKYVLKGIICAAYYEEGPLKELIHNYKYNHVTELTEILGGFMYAAAVKNPSTSKGDILISFTPLHRKRLAQRGYNQAQLLAETVGLKLGLPVADLLTKNRNTKRQVILHGDERRKNLENLFNVKSDINIKNKIIILVDDVMTTGTTLNECAKVLKVAGAKEVWGLVIARG